MEIIKIVQGGIELDVIGSVDASSIIQDANNRFVTDAEKTTWNNKQDKLTAGTNVTITGTTISSKDTTYDAATTSANGLMSSADKVKLNGVETGAQKNSVTSVQGRTGAVTISKADVGLSNTPNYGVATQVEAEAGTVDTKLMTPLRVKQAIDKLTPATATQAEAEAGTNDIKLMTPLRVKQAVLKLAPTPNYPVKSVNNKTGAVTISKSDVGLGSVNNVAITAAQVTKINELNYTRALTQAQYSALSTSEKNRTDVWYGIYEE